MLSLCSHYVSLCIIMNHYAVIMQSLWIIMQSLYIIMQSLYIIMQLLGIIMQSLCIIVICLPMMAWSHWGLWIVEHDRLSVHMTGMLDGYANTHHAHPLIANAQRRAENEWKRLSTGYACPSVSRTETRKLKSLSDRLRGRTIPPPLTARNLSLIANCSH